MGQLNVGQIVTDANIETDTEDRKGDKARPVWEQRALLRMLDEQLRCEAMRTAAFGNDD